MAPVHLRGFSMRYALLGLVALTTAAICGLPGLARAEPMATIGAIAIHDAWARASLGQTGTSAVYMILEASGDQGDRLVGAASPAAASAELHTHLVEGGVAKMRPVAGVEIEPGAPTVLEPGGLHIMLIGVRNKLVEGEALPLSLTFEDAGTIEVEVPIRGVGSGVSHGGRGGHQPPSN
jgi:copper(I)-binding protein